MEKVTLKGRITANRMDRTGVKESQVSIEKVSSYGVAQEQKIIFDQCFDIDGIYPLGAEVTVEVKVR